MPYQSSDRQGGLDLARKIELALAVLFAFSAIVGQWYTIEQVRSDLRTSQKELGLTREELSLAQEGQVTDRYIAAVESLGDDAMDVRLGGIYALQRIMEDSARDHPTIGSVLAAYIRTHAARPLKKNESIPADVHAAYTVLAHRDPAHDGDLRINLRGVHLPGAALPRIANHGEPGLKGAHLTTADLSEADLRGADLGYSELVMTDLRGADLRRTLLHYARLQDADLRDADLRDAVMIRTNLFSADLRDADLRDARLGGADLRWADLRGARLDGTDLGGADLRSANLAGEVSVKQLVSAVIYSNTKLTPDLASDPAVRARIAEVEKSKAK